MSDLSPITRALLDTGRDGEEPNLRDYERNRRALARRLGAGALAASVGLSATTGAATGNGAWAAGVLAKIVLPFVMGGVVAGTALGTMRMHETATRDAPLLGSTSPVVPVLGTATVRAIAETPLPHGSATPVIDDPRPAPPDETSAEVSPTTAHAPATRRTSEDPMPVAPRAVADSLPTAQATAPSTVAEEIDLLRQAEERFHAGAPASALALLDRHARQFPNGALAEERRASRILVLCQLGQVAAARAEADAFVRQSPASPFVERVRRACSAER